MKKSFASNRCSTRRGEHKVQQLRGGEGGGGSGMRSERGGGGGGEVVRHGKATRRRKSDEKESLNKYNRSKNKIQLPKATEGSHLIHSHSCGDNSEPGLLVFCYTNLCYSLLPILPRRLATPKTRNLPTAPLSMPQARATAPPSITHFT